MFGNYSNYKVILDEEMSDSQSSNYPYVNETPAQEQAEVHNEFYYSTKFDALLDDLVRDSTNMETWEKLHLLGDAFVHDANLFGRVIIEEQVQKFSTKTISEAKIGGVAGGTKFISHGILFKFAQDVEVADGRWLYGGAKRTDAFAAKSAGQELFASNYVGSVSPSIRVPLMALVDYWGYRLVASALLPLGSNSLVYGSDDAGGTVHCHPSVQNEMDSIGAAFNLRKHTISHCHVQLATCADIEVHYCSFQGTYKYYCIDSARLFPPEYHSHPPSIFYQKLRPEFLRNHPVPLSSDGFTMFQDPAESSVLNKDCRDATAALHRSIENYVSQRLLIPEVIDGLINQTSRFYTLQWSSRDYVPNPLVMHMHRHGINLRHLGKVLFYVLEKSKPVLTRNNKFTFTDIMGLNRSKSTSTSDRNYRLGKYIYNVMILRVIKNYTKNILREKISCEREYFEKVISIMNCITHPSESEGMGPEFWKTIVPQLLIEKFGDTVQVGKLLEYLHQGFLLLNYCQLLGIILHPRAWEMFTRKYGSDMRFKFCIADIVEIKPTTKYSNYIDLATGIYFANCALAEAQRGDDADQRINSNFIQKASDRFSSALASWSNLNNIILPNTFSDMQSYVSKKSLDDWHLHSSSKHNNNAGSHGALSPTSSHPNLTVNKPQLYHSLTPTMWNRRVDDGPSFNEEITMGSTTNMSQSMGGESFSLRGPTIEMNSQGDSQMFVQPNQPQHGLPVYQQPPPVEFQPFQQAPQNTTNNENASFLPSGQFFFF